MVQKLFLTRLTGGTDQDGTISVRVISDVDRTKVITILTEWFGRIGI